MKWAVVGFLILSVLHIHFRGKVRLPFGRQLFDVAFSSSRLNYGVNKVRFPSPVPVGAALRARARAFPLYHS